MNTHNISGKGQEAVRADAFEEFIVQAKPHVLRNIGELCPRLDALSQWIAPDDFLGLLGCTLVEDTYTELLAWALWPPQQPQVALAAQRAWLKALGFHVEIHAAARPHTQFGTADGIPDLVLDYRPEKFLVVVEAKTVTEEHCSPSGEMQTISYPAAVRSQLGLPSDYPTAMVFLTTTGTAATSPDAINTTYVDLVMTLALALPLEDIPPNLRHNYFLLFTHLLTHATPDGTNAAKGIVILKDLLESGSDEETLIAHLRDVKPALDVLAVGET